MADMAIDQRSGHRGRNDVTAALSLGSNAADAAMRVSAIAAILSSRFGVTALTRVFKTSDIHMSALRPPLAPVPPYANAVALVRVPKVPLLSASWQDMTAELKVIETQLGRRREHKEFGLVNADIDLVVYGSVILRPGDFMRPYFFPYALEL